jgi:ATP phosphoribosyltransferase regulatory subunit
VSLYDICEVLYLALKSLESIDKNYIIDIAHAGLVSALINKCELSGDIRSKVFESIQNKSIDEITSIFQNELMTKFSYDIITKLVSTYKSCDEVINAFGGISEDIDAQLNEFSVICKSLSDMNLTDKVRIDFSIVNDTSYYSGLVFKGYIAGIFTSVLSGGQYDKLMKKMGRKAGAIGFAVYMDMLERLEKEENRRDVDAVLLYDKSASVALVAQQVKKLTAEGMRVLAQPDIPAGVRYGKLLKLQGSEVVTLEDNA